MPPAGPRPTPGPDLVVRAPWRPFEPLGGTWEEQERIHSIQWIDLPGCPPLSFPAIEQLYFAWVPRLSAQMVQPRWEAPDGPLRLAIEPLRWPNAIRMAAPRQDPEMWSRPILGGLLAYGEGSLDFELRRPRPNGRRLVVAVRGLRPRMPRDLYYPIQSQLHERSTFAYLREIARRLRRGTLTPLVSRPRRAPRGGRRRPRPEA